MSQNDNTTISRYIWRNVWKCVQIITVIIFRTQPVLGCEERKRLIKWRDFKCRFIVIAVGPWWIASPLRPIMTEATLFSDSVGGCTFNSGDSVVEWWNDGYATQKFEIIGTWTSKINCENAVVTDWKLNLGWNRDFAVFAAVEKIIGGLRCLLYMGSVL